MRFTGWVIFFSFWLCSCITCVESATIVLNNGDRVSGELVSQDNEQVVLESRVFGRLAIPVTEVAEIEADSSAPAVPAEPTTDGQEAVGSVTEEDAREGARVATTQTPASGKSTTAKKTEGPVALTAEEVARSLEETRELKEVVDRLLQTPVVGSIVQFFRKFSMLKDWNTKFDLSLTFVQGQADSQAMGVFLTSSRQWGKRDVRITASQEYGTTEDANGNDVVSLDRTRAAFRYRHDLMKRLFVQSNTAYLQDHVKAIDHQIDESLGIGWRYLDGPSWQASITPSLTLQYQNLAGSNTPDQTVDGWNIGPSISEEVVFKMNDHITFRHEAWLRLPEAKWDLMSYMWSIRMETKVLQNVTFNTGYELTYDGFVSDDLEKTQHTIKTSVGIAF